MWIFGGCSRPLLHQAVGSVSIAQLGSKLICFHERDQRVENFPVSALWTLMRFSYFFPFVFSSSSMHLRGIRLYSFQQAGTPTFLIDRCPLFPGCFWKLILPSVSKEFAQFTSGADRTSKYSQHTEPRPPLEWSDPFHVNSFNVVQILEVECSLAAHDSVCIRSCVHFIESSRLFGVSLDTRIEGLCQF